MTTGLQGIVGEPGRRADGRWRWFEDADLVVAADQLLFNWQNRRATAAKATLLVSLDLNPREGESV